MPNSLLIACQEALDHAKRYGGKGKKRAKQPTRKQMRALRERLDLSQVAFAKQYGLSLYQVQKLERRAS